MRFLVRCLLVLVPITLITLYLMNRDDRRWFKGNTHTHSLWSDGNDFPDMIAAWYKDKGYDFLCISDHNVLAQGEKWIPESVIEKRKMTLGATVTDKYRQRFGDSWVVRRNDPINGKEIQLKPLDQYRRILEEPGKFLMIQAEEITSVAGKSHIHINAINLKEVLTPINNLASVRETIRANLKAVIEQSLRTGQPMISHINHPNFLWALTPDDLAYVVEDRFFEIYNGHPEVNNSGDEARVDSNLEKVWDIANTIRIAELKQPPLFGIASDDSHHYHGGIATPGRGWVMVLSKELQANQITEAMHNGDFYASTGVVLDHVRLSSFTRKLSLKIQSQPGVKYRTEFRGTMKNYNRSTQEVASPGGDPQAVRIKHGDDIGVLLASSDSLNPSYKMTGDELYVRAIVTSDQTMDNPSQQPGEFKKAWTQPVGWESHLSEGP